MGNEQSLQPGIPQRATSQHFQPPDPFVFFGLTLDSTPSEAKRAYYKKAQEYHPDRHGDPRVFGWIHQAYIQVLHQLEEQKLRVDEHATRRKQYQELKRQQETNAAADDTLQKSYDIPKKPKATHKTGNKNITNTQTKVAYEAPIPEGPAPKFQVERFNEVFEKTRQATPMDRGYSAEEMDAEMNKYGGSVNEQLQNATREQFMSAFDNQKKNWQSLQLQNENQRRNQLAVYRGPEALVSSSLISNVQELGGDTPDDFTASSGALQYTDYLGAYTRYHNLENPDVDISNRHKSIDAYQAERSNIQYTKTPEQEAQEAAYKAWEEEQEKIRIERLLEQDRIAMQQHEKAKKFYLQKR
jgi:curved DNA-binding protein CbpA